MSFNKFAMVCADFNLFSSDKQDQYLNIASEEDLKKKWKKTAFKWMEIHERISDRLDYLKRNISEEDHEQWSTSLSVLNERMLM